MRNLARRILMTAAALSPWAVAANADQPAAPPAFPGAVGQGAAAVGGRDGDVYHVTNLDDYHPRSEEKIPGSLRHAIRSAQGPRTIVFDVGGAIALKAPLEISKSRLTIAGQTAPGGVTVWGYPVEIGHGSDVIVRYLRCRLGDFRARRPAGASPAQLPGGTMDDRADLDPGSANAVNVGDGAQRVILDHVSASWGMDETLSVTNCRDVTVQHCLIASSLNDSFHPKGPHGYGSLIRGLLSAEDQAAGRGGYTLYGNLWAHHRARNPSLGGQQRLESGKDESQRLRTDVNVLNNVIYDWGDQATHRSELGAVRANLIGNCYVTGPAKAAKYFFRENTDGPTEVYSRDNWQDFDRDAEHDGQLVAGADASASALRDFGDDDVLRIDGEPLPFLGGAANAVVPAQEAYRRIVASVGASLSRDAFDAWVVASLQRRRGKLIDSQDELRDERGRLPGLDDVAPQRRPEGFDEDRDGLADEFETARGLDPGNPDDRNGADLSPEGYTNLEVYLNSLTERQP